MLARISSSELTAWMAYERVTGTLGAERADMHAATVAATVVNANKGKKGRRATVRDFMPRWDRPGMDWREQLAAVRQWNRALRGVDRTRGEVPGGDPGEPAGEDRRRRRPGRAGPRPR